MAKKQSRKSISVKAETYVRAKRAAARIEGSVSDMTEQALHKLLDELREPNVDRKDAITELNRKRPKPAEPISEDDIISQHFTF